MSQQSNVSAVQTKDAGSVRLVAVATYEAVVRALAFYADRPVSGAVAAETLALLTAAQERPHYYLLNDRREPVACEMLVWAHTHYPRHVARDDIRSVCVSTVFLGIDHNFSGRGAPVLFETMVFGDRDYDQLQCRYCTWDEAAAGHALVLNHVREPAWSRWLTCLFSGLVGPLGEQIGGATA